MPARKKRRRKKAKGKNQRSFRVYFYAIVIILVLLMYGYIRITSKFWDGKGRLSVVYPRIDGNVEVVIFDGASGELTNIIVPGDTQVDVAHNLGLWRLKSVWKLGENEGIGGELLAATATKHFKFPTDAWSGSGFEGVIDGNVYSVFGLVIFSGDSNLPMTDRLKLALFAFSVPNSKRMTINLADTSMLKKAQLSDGEDGYLVSGKLPPNIMALFADPDISREEIKIVLENASGKQGLPKTIGEIIEALGAKIALVENVQEQDVDCIVASTDERMANKISRLFGCDKKIRGEGVSFDVQMVIGKRFAERF